MAFKIRMGIPEMADLWNKLQIAYRNGTISKKGAELYRKLGNTLKKLSENPQYPSLKTHEITVLSKRYGIKVWQSYLENNRSQARRIFWLYGPGKSEITIIGLEPHPEDSKKGAYDRITLSNIV